MARVEARRPSRARRSRRSARLRGRLTRDGLAGDQQLAEGEPEVRAAVERAIAKLGYSPNQAARSLVTRRTDAIALVVCEPESRVFADPFFAAVVRGIGTAAPRPTRTSC